jgi:hypothetical protein
LGQPPVPCSLSSAGWSEAHHVGTVNKVIHEVDIALRSLIEREATDGTEVEVVFDAPTKDWASRRNVPTIDVYLYDIREDLRRRERGLINEYDERDRITTRHLPPRHFKLSYLVTAWTQRPEDEHRLLAALLSCFLRHDAIPGEFVTGPLAELGLPVPVTVALPPPEDRSFADVWTALGGELKPSLDVVVSAPTNTGQKYAAGPPVVKPGRISIGGVAGWPPREEREQTNGSAALRAAQEPGTAPAGTDKEGGSSGSGAHPDPSAHGSGPGSSRPGGSRPGGSRAGMSSPPASAAGGSAGVPIAGGMSWREFAGSASSRRIVEPQTPVDVPADADEPPAKPKPPARRRRQGGISEK